MVYTYTPPEHRDSCNCDYCNEETTNNEEEKENKNISLEQEMYKEDSDGDGNRTICARDRDLNDKTFLSVCHMLCYNRCLALRLSTVTDTEIHVVNAYRSNYYKLRDGEC